MFGIKTMVINYIANSLETGAMRTYFIQALRVLVSKTSNTIDDTLVDVIELALSNKKIDDKVQAGIKELIEKAK